MLPCDARLHFVVLGTLWLLGTASHSAAAERLASDEAIAPRTATPPQIDGDFSDPVWQSATRVDGLDVDEVVLTTDSSWIPEGTINYF